MARVVLSVQAMDSTRPRSRQDSVRRRRLEARRVAPVQPLAGELSGSSGWSGGPGTYRLRHPAGGRDDLRPAAPRRRTPQGSGRAAPPRRVARGSAVLSRPAPAVGSQHPSPPEREPTLRTAAPLWTPPPAVAPTRSHAAAVLLPIALAGLVAFALVAIALVAR